MKLVPNPTTVDIPLTNSRLCVTVVRKKLKTSIKITKTKEFNISNSPALVNIVAPYNAKLAITYNDHTPMDVIIFPNRS